MARRFGISHPNPRYFFVEGQFEDPARHMETQSRNVAIIMDWLGIPEERTRKIALSEAKRHKRRGEQEQADILAKVFRFEDV
jgi:hypothetical protein